LLLRLIFNFTARIEYGEYSDGLQEFWAAASCSRLTCIPQ